MENVQKENQELMVVFTNLIRAILLHVTERRASETVRDERRQAFMLKLEESKEYQDWLADRFFVFYLNRTKIF